MCPVYSGKRRGCKVSVTYINHFALIQSNLRVIKRNLGLCVQLKDTSACCPARELSHWLSLRGRLSWATAAALQRKIYFVHVPNLQTMGCVAICKASACRWPLMVLTDYQKRNKGKNGWVGGSQIDLLALPVIMRNIQQFIFWQWEKRSSC